jgi:hypothetical protein
MIAETEDLLDSLKAHKPDILAALAHPDGIALWWRVAILVEPSGRTVEVDTPSGTPSLTGKPTPSAITALGAP